MELAETSLCSISYHRARTATQREPWRSLLVGFMSAALLAKLSPAYAQPTAAELEAAANGQLPLVAAANRPPFATYFSWQQGWPAPEDPFPELDTYALGGSRYLMDDRDLDYDLLGGMDIPSPAEFNAVGADYGCGLWLDISVSSNNSAAVLLTMHNTRPDQVYTIWSLTNLSLTNWIVETNLAGAAGDFTEVSIPKNGRPMLFLRASEVRDYSTDTNYTFTSLGLLDSVAWPSDSTGAVGPNHFLEVLNGSSNAVSSVAAYNKSGGLAASARGVDFFALTNRGTNYPTDTYVYDPRVLYDHQYHAWVTCALDYGTRQLLMAVSTNESPTNLITGWSRHLVELSSGLQVADFDTLGLDDNGLYIAAAWGHTGTNSHHVIVAIKKPEIYQGTLLTKTFELTNDLPIRTIQPAVNFDRVPTNGYAWFLGKRSPDSGTNYQGGLLVYRRLQWSGTNATLDTNWFAVTNSVYRDHFELEYGTNYAPQATNQGGVSLELYETSGHPAMSVIRNGFLWTCYTIGLSGTNGTYVGDVFGSNVDRSGVQWVRLSVDATNGSLSYKSHGRIYDTGSASPYWYYYPSLMVNCAGDMVIAFSGSSVTNYIGAFYSFHLVNAWSSTQPKLIRDGTDPYLDNVRWGDYSATTLDPSDDWSFWTVQEYAHSPNGVDNTWATVIARIRPKP
jgi:hypothetical protein